MESICSSISKIAASFTPPAGEESKNNCFCVVHSEMGVVADLVSKYRPAFPVFVATPNDQLLRTCRAKFGQIPIKMPITEGPSAVVAKCIKQLGKMGFSMHKGVRAIFLGHTGSGNVPFVRIINTGIPSPAKLRTSLMDPSGLALARVSACSFCCPALLWVVSFSLALDIRDVQGRPQIGCGHGGFMAVSKRFCLQGPPATTRTSQSQSAPPTPTWK